MSLARALEALEAASAEILDTALDFPALIPRKRKRDKTSFAQERVALKRAVLDAQREEEDNLRKLKAQQQAAGEDRLPADRVEAEERLQTSIASLKTQLFDLTVDLQQSESVLERIYLSKVVASEAAAEAAAAATLDADPDARAKADAGFMKRDKLAARVLQLARECRLADEEEADLQRLVLRRQAEAREKWASNTVPSSPAHDGPKAARKLNAAEENRLRHHNAWLRHVLTTMIQEAKINWAAHPELRAAILGEPIP